MKFLSVEVGGKELRVVCANVFETYDSFKAEMVVEVEDAKDVFKLSGSYKEYSIRGVHFDYADLLLDGEMYEREMYIDFVESVEHWAKCYIQIDF